MKKMIRMACILLAVLCASPIYSAQRNDANDLKTIFNEINAYRFKHGLAQLKWNAAISQEAAKHSRDMASSAVPFGHKGYEKRMRRLFSEINHAHRFAENVAYSYTDPTDSIQTWIDSSPHRRNILGAYNQTGIGIAYGPNRRVYVTQIFIKS